MKLTKNQRKTLVNFVSFDCRLYQQISGTYYFDDDAILPYRPGVTFHQCIDLGLIEKYTTSHERDIFRATNLGQKFKCPQNMCRHGMALEIDESDGYADDTGKKCETCDGYGVVLEVKDDKLE